LRGDSRKLRHDVPASSSSFIIAASAGLGFHDYFDAGASCAAGTALKSTADAADEAADYEGLQEVS